MTTTHDAKELRENVRNVAIDFLACGFDPSRGVFFKTKLGSRSQRACLDPLDSLPHGSP